MAIVEDQIQLTRCTTCDTEHPYKAARVPRRRKKTETGALYEQVLAGRDRDVAAEDDPTAEARLAAPDADLEPEAEPVPFVAADEAAEEPAAAPADVDPQAVAGDDPPGGPVVEDGPVRRPLIRATLPRPEGQPVVRQPPEFTIRQSGGRGGFRQDARGGNRNGGRPSGGQGHQRHGQRSGFGQGRQGSQHGGRQDRHAGQARHNRPSQHARSGKKRSR